MSSSRDTDIHFRISGVPVTALWAAWVEGSKYFLDWWNAALDFAQHWIALGVIAAAAVFQKWIVGQYRKFRGWLQAISEAQTRLADIEEAKFVVRESGARVRTTRDPIAASRSLRPHILWSAYQEWRNRSMHLAAGGDAAANLPEYLPWLMRALRYLDVILIEAARTDSEAQWLRRIRVSLAPHAAGLRRCDEADFENPNLKQLIRDAKLS